MIQYYFVLLIKNVFNRILCDDIISIVLDQRFSNISFSKRWINSSKQNTHYGIK